LQSGGFGLASDGVQGLQIFLGRAKRHAKIDSGGVHGGGTAGGKDIGSLGPNVVDVSVDVVVVGDCVAHAISVAAVSVTNGAGVEVPFTSLSGVRLQSSAVKFWISLKKLQSKMYIAVLLLDE